MYSCDNASSVYKDIISKCQTEFINGRWTNFSLACLLYIKTCMIDKVFSLYLITLLLL
jgi:hypothetical protein